MELTFRDLVVVDELGNRVAVRDFPDNGPAVLLLHGAGLNLASWDSLIRLLPDRFHVVAIDLLGHGASDTPAEFCIEADLAAVSAVIAKLSLENPALIGHSYGGMIAVQYAIDHPGCPIAVNIDGTSNGLIEHYAGKTADEVRAYWQQSEEAIQSAPSVEVTGPTSWRDAEIAKAPQLADALGFDLETVTAMTERTFQSIGGDQWEARPLPEFSADLMRKLDSFEPYELYHQAHSPTVLVLATRDPAAGGVEADFQRAHRIGLGAALENLMRDHPELQLRRIDSAHLVPLENPSALAELMVDLLDGR